LELSTDCPYTELRLDKTFCLAVAAVAALQVPAKVLNSYRIVKVEAPEAGVTMFVVRSRNGASAQPPPQQQQLPQGTGSSSSSSEEGQPAAVQLPGTEAEAAATIKSCKVRGLLRELQLALALPVISRAWALDLSRAQHTT
jgi:hypothetical protein